MQVLEHGDIRVLPRGAPAHDEPIEVETLWMVLAPHDTDQRRLLLLGRLPRPHPGVERVWGYVTLVTDDEDRLACAMSAGGSVPLPDATVDGVYALGVSDHTAYLAYALASDRDEGAPDLAVEGVYGVTVRNPRGAFAPLLGLPDHPPAQLPSSLQDRFEGRRWLPADPPQLLDHADVDLAFIAAAGDEAGLRPLDARDLSTLDAALIEARASRRQRVAR